MSTNGLDALIDHVEHFQRRVLREAIRDGTAAHWRARAEAFESARPRPGDYPGRSTELDLREADRRCREAAEACRARARTAPLDSLDDLLEVVA